MGHWDDVYEQYKWDYAPLWYKRTHPAPCPELISEETKLELLTVKDWQEKIAALENQLAEKDAMIDWLAEKACQCAESRIQHGYCSYMNSGCTICIQNRNMPTPDDWKEAAQEAVKKDA